MASLVNYPTASGVSFWEDDLASIHSTDLRSDVPPMPNVTMGINTVRGGPGVLIYLMHQVIKSTNKLTIMRAIASSMSCIFADSVNYTGSQAPCVPLTGLERVTDESVTDRTTLLDTNFPESEPVTLAEIDAYMDMDVDELAMYFGVLCFAGIKRVTPENRTAFNEKRANSVQAQTIGDLKIFVQNSPELDDVVLHKVYASFISWGNLRCHMMSKCAARMGSISYGPASAFTTMFMLLVDQGMGALRIIKEAVLKYPWLRHEFTELAPEFALANKAQNTIRKATSTHRPFLKSIYGSSFVPLPYQQAKNLVGICKRTLQDTAPTYKNYNGGIMTDIQEQKLIRLLAKYGVTAPLAANDDAVDATE